MLLFQSVQMASKTKVNNAEKLRDIFWELEEEDQVLIYEAARQLYECQTVQHKRQIDRERMVGRLVAIAGGKETKEG